MWLKTSYIALSVIISLILIAIAFYAINQTEKNRQQAILKKNKVAIGILIWHIYAIVLDQMGLMNDFELPPKFAVFLIVPAFLFTGIFMYSNRNQQWIQNIPTSWLIFYQTFRIAIELLFVYSVSAGILHPNVTIEGYNYDMVFGFTALLVGVAFVYNKLSIYLLRIWNYLGLAVIAVIIFLFITTIYTPQFYGAVGPLMPIDITYYPYLLVPGFLMPSAVFVHVLLLVKLRKVKD
jgi:hypothetical protein